MNRKDGQQKVLHVDSGKITSYSIIAQILKFGPMCHLEPVD